jgi:hypothetical protein
MSWTSSTITRGISKLPVLVLYVAGLLSAIAIDAEQAVQELQNGEVVPFYLMPIAYF